MVTNTETKIIPIIALLLINICSCFDYTYNEAKNARWCDVDWYFLGEDSWNNSVVMKNISNSSRMDCYMSCDVMEGCGGAAIRESDECLLINETAIPLNTVNRAKKRNATTDLMITEVTIRKQ